MTSKSRTQLQAQSTKVLEQNYPRESQETYFILEAYAR